MPGKCEVESVAVSQLSMWERDTLLQLVQSSHSATDRRRLAVWLHDEVGQVLPNVALVCIAGDVAVRRLSLDVLSIAEGKVLTVCPECRRQLIRPEVLEQWCAGQRRMLSIAGMQGVVDGTCDCLVATRLRSACSVLVHGLRDERSGEDVLYLLFGVEPFRDPHQQAIFAMLLPQVDFACRRLACADERFEEAGCSVEAGFQELREGAMISMREQEILEWVRAGKTNNEIGQILNISTFTVKNHLQRIYRKIDVINRAQAVGKLEEYARSR
jgi:transcriptional regulator EpsA